MDKESIRARVKARKNLLDDAERASAAESVFGLIEKTAAFIMSEHILMYNSLPDELSTRDFISRWKSVKHFFLPRVNGIDLDILPYDSTRMSLGAFRIEEPQGDDITDPALMELIIVPAMAYDRKGNRLGRGKGYYDRLLPRSKALRIGVAYDFQLVDELETDPFDQPVDIVITESGIYRRR